MSHSNADLLIHRVLEGNAHAGDRRAFEELAAARPELWRELGRRLWDQRECAAALAADLGRADRVELPFLSDEPAAGERPSLNHRARKRLAPTRPSWFSALRPASSRRAAVAWSGWLAAAALLVSMVLRPSGSAHDVASLSAGKASLEAAPASQLDESSRDVAASDPQVSVQAAYEEYVRSAAESGVLYDELPLVMLQTRALPESDEVEVLYMRRLIEKTRVRELLEVARDEHGLPHAVPASGLPLAAQAYF